MSATATELLALLPDWDSYGAPAIDPEAVRRAEALVRLMQNTKAQFVPTSDGGVSIEWYGADGEMCISFAPGLDGLYLTFPTEGDEFELAATP